MAESEIELKLRLDPGEIERFRRDPLIHRNKRGRAQSKTLIAVYFDTVDLDLKNRKTALRIRQEGAQRIQTLKRSIGGAGLQRRIEFNAPVTGEVPSLTLIDDDGVQSEMEEVLGGKELLPVFTTDIRRTAWLLDLSGGAVELALDIGHIESQGRTVPVCEAELELKGGTAGSLLDFADVLASRFKCRVAEESKAARGYGLFLQEPPCARRAQKLVLNAADPAWTSLGRIVEEGTAQLFANEASILQGTDIDGVHQARVAVRRTRAALSAFGAILPEEVRKPLNRALRRQQLGLGPARDWDVFISETLTPLLAEADAPKALSRFAERAETARELAYRQARKTIRSPRYGRLQLALIRFPYLNEPNAATEVSTVQIGANLLQERLDIILEAAGENPLDLPEEALHALRIDIKKLRYAIDFFESIYKKQEVKPWRSATRKLQDCLGGLNDAVIHGQLVDAMDAPDRPVPKAVRRYVEAYLGRQQTEGLSTLEARWTTFKSLQPFWR